jgi:diaminopimelate decarboxylase
LESPFQYLGGVLCCDGVPLDSTAQRHGTPAYVYSAAGIAARFRAYDDSFGDLPHRICFAVKANSNLAVLNLLARLGAGFDIVSGGELHRVLTAFGDPAKVVFSGVGKTAAEMEFAIGRGIHSFNSESEAELELLSRVAAGLGANVRVALRVNPDVDAVTHPYISTGLRDHKFGVDIDMVERLYDRAAELPGLTPEGISCHIGSQLLDPAPLLEALDRVLALAGRLRDRGLPIAHIDLGGGLGVAYESRRQAPPIASYVAEARRRLRDCGLTVMLEPGRSIVADCGVLLSRVIYRKRSTTREFVVVDAAMNDLIRPALYQAHHEIVPLAEPAGDARMVADVVGPVCETGDFLARNRELPEIAKGDLVAILTAGAYGFVQASNYNSRPRAAEILVENNAARLVRERETYDDLIRGETL